MPSENYGKVVRMREKNPCLILSDIGDKIGISGERVRQILKDAGLPTRHYHYIQKYYCSGCGKQLQGTKNGLCRKCNKFYNMIPLVCEECGDLFYRYKAFVINNRRRGQDHIFCGHPCHGKWLARTHGFVAHLENCGRKPKGVSYGFD